MTLGQFIAAYHTEVSLVFGPALVFALFRWCPLPTWLNLGIALASMFFFIGLWGIILNAWVLVSLALWLASKRRRGLQILRYLTLGISVILLVAAAAFYLFLLFTKPGELFRDLGNPLLYLYALPGVLMFLLSQHFVEKAALKSTPASATGAGGR